MISKPELLTVDDMRPGLAYLLRPRTDPTEPFYDCMILARCIRKDTLPGSGLARAIMKTITARTGKFKPVYTEPASGPWKLMNNAWHIERAGPQLVVEHTALLRRMDIVTVVQ